MRVYLPTTTEGLRELADGRLLPGDPDRVTATSEDEHAEYDALMTAAEASAALLDGPGRRVVVVAEVEALADPVTLREVVAVHCDTEDRASGADPDDPPGWFATQEIPDLI